ncbi:MAG TPA: multiheme c-type cytochrome [Candidatus Hypogeohydataceae bacterium YC41]
MAHYFPYLGRLRKVPLAFGLVLLMGCSHPELVRKGEGSPPAERCGECHVEIYKEWETSPHASSFSSEDFKEGTQDYSFKFCLGCHVPESMYVEGEPRPRTTKLEEGVNCDSCHLTEDCKLAGPLKSRSPHPVGQEYKLYLKSKLCGKCHIKTFKEWQESAQKDKKTCQHCHMPAVKRKLIQDDPWQRLYRGKDIKRHTFSPVESASGKLASERLVRIDLEGLKLVQGEAEGAGGPNFQGKVVVENTSIPHSLPTGDYGYREVVLKISLKGPGGDGILIKEESFFVEMETSLKSGEKRAFCLSIPRSDLKENTSLTVELMRKTFQGETKLVLACEEFPLEKEGDGVVTHKKTSM